MDGISLIYEEDAEIEDHMRDANLNYMSPLILHTYVKTYHVLGDYFNHHSTVVIGCGKNSYINGVSHNVAKITLTDSLMRHQPKQSIEPISMMCKLCK